MGKKSLVTGDKKQMAVVLPLGSFLSSSRNKNKALTVQGPGLPILRPPPQQSDHPPRQLPLTQPVGGERRWGRPTRSFSSAGPSESSRKSQARRLQANSRGPSGRAPGRAGSGGRAGGEAERLGQVESAGLLGFSRLCPIPANPARAAVLVVPSSQRPGTRLRAPSVFRRPPGHL